MHDMPGDVPKQAKIAMLEGKDPDKRKSKAYKKMLQMRERATLKRQGVVDMGREVSEGFDVTDPDDDAPDGEVVARGAAFGTFAAWRRRVQQEVGA